MQRDLNSDYKAALIVHGNCDVPVTWSSFLCYEPGMALKARIAPPARRAALQKMAFLICVAEEPSQMRAAPNAWKSFSETNRPELVTPSQ